MTEHGVVEVQDFMPVLRAHDPDHRQRLVRRVVGLRGSVDLTMHMAPRPDYGRHRPGPERRGRRRPLRRRRRPPGPVEHGRPRRRRDRGDGTAGTGHRRVRAVRARGPGRRASRPGRCDDSTSPSSSRPRPRFWRGWLAQSTYTGRWREMGRPLGAHPQAAVPTSPPAASSPRRPPASPRASAATATGTTATCGSATPRSASTPCSASASPTRRRRSSASCPSGSARRPTARTTSSARCA